VKSQDVHLHPFLEDLIETYQLWANQSGRTVTYVASDEITVTSDPRYLRQILHNLLTNAVRHGRGPIRVTLARTPDGAVCRIENEIAPSKVGQQRTGMGLRIARALAPNLGCQIDARAVGERFVAELHWRRQAPSTNTC